MLKLNDGGHSLFGADFVANQYVSWLNFGPKDGSVRLVWFFRLHLKLDNRCVS